MKINLDTINQCGVRIYDANGVEVEQVIEADTNTGLVLRLLPNSAAKVYEYRPFPLKVIYADEDDFNKSIGSTADYDDTDWD